MICLALILPCVLAGFRELSVGTDTGKYVLNYYRVAPEFESFHDYKVFINDNFLSNDTLYMLLSYIFGKMGIPFSVLLFIFELLIIVPTYFSIKNFSKKDSNIMAGMMFFYLMMYNLSLNMVRQSIAIAFALLGFSILVRSGTNSSRKDLIKSIVLLFVAIGFHDSAIIMLPIYILYKFYSDKRINRKLKISTSVIIGTLCIIGLVFHYPILIMIGESGIYPKALLYLERHYTFDINYLGTLLNILLLAIVYFNRKNFAKKNINSQFLILLAFMNLSIGFIGTFITYSQRIAYYMLFILMLDISPLLSFDKIKDILSMRKEYLYFLSLCVITILHWIIVIAVNNGNETLPYLFRGL